MRGAESVIEDELYEGNVKSAGLMAAVLFKKAHDEGCHIELEGPKFIWKVILCSVLQAPV